MTSLHTIKSGESKQFPILALLHGWGSSSKIWQPCISELSREFQVWCIDLPGHGGSVDIDWDCSAEQGVELLANTLPNSCVLIGWSLGGLFAQLYLKAFPQRVQQLLLIASTPKFITSAHWPHGMPIDEMNNFKQSFQSSPLKTLKRFNCLQTLHSDWTKEAALALEHSMMTKYFDKISWGLEWLTELDLTKFKPPIRIQCMQGENDQVCSPQAAKAMVKVWPNVYLNLIKKSGHVPFLSHKQIFIKQVRRMMHTVED